MLLRTIVPASSGEANLPSRRAEPKARKRRFARATETRRSGSRLEAAGELSGIVPAELVHFR